MSLILAKLEVEEVLLYRSKSYLEKVMRDTHKGLNDLTELLFSYYC